ALGDRCVMMSAGIPRALLRGRGGRIGSVAANPPLDSPPVRSPPSPDLMPGSARRGPGIILMSPIIHRCREGHASIPRCDLDLVARDPGSGRLWLRIEHQRARG